MATDKPARGFSAQRLPDWAAAATLANSLPAEGAATPFQTLDWLSVFHKSFGAREGVDAVPIHVVDGTGATAMLLPLLRIRANGRTTIEFADLGVTDYNLPILGPAAPAGQAEADAAWAAVRRALPPADLLVFTKMPAEIAGAPNPIAAVLPIAPSRLFGNYVVPGDDYAAWVHGLGKHERKELGRLWRVFTREPDTRYVRAGSVEEAGELLSYIERNQSARIRSLGLPYILDEPDYAGFYRSLLEGVPSGRTIVSALVAGSEVVAGLFMIGDGRQVAMIRLAFSDGKWANCSPGRLIMDRTMSDLHAAGYRVFDFTIGDYAHKRAFKAAHLPLYDATLALSVKGLPTVGLARAKAYVKGRPALEKLVRSIFSRDAA